MINKNQCSKWKWRRWFLSGHCKSPARPLPLFSFVIVMLLTLATCQCVLHKCHQSVFIFICKCSLNSWHHNVINWYLHNITVLIGRCWEPTTYLPQCVRISQCPFRCWFLKLTVNNVIRVRPQEEWSVHCLCSVFIASPWLCAVQAAFPTRQFWRPPWRLLMKTTPPSAASNRWSGRRTQWSRRRTQWSRRRTQWSRRRTHSCRGWSRRKSR